MSSDHSLTMLSSLLIRQLSDGLQPEDYARLKTCLAEDAEARQYYVEFMALNAHLHKQRVASLASESLDIELGEANSNDIGAFTQWLDEAGFDEAQSPEPNPEHVNEIRRIAEQRLASFMAEQEQLRRQEAVYLRDRSGSLLVEHLNYIARRVHTTVTWTLRNALRLTALATMVLLGLAVTQYVLRQRVVATLDEAIHARWEQPPADPNLHPGPMVLEEGFAKLTFKQGAEIILQAPCAFDLASKNKMILHHGVVTAQVPAQALGFAIKTPQSTVTDFGTEFGVQVQASTASEVHVFDGRVQVKTVSRSQRPSQRRDVSKGKAALITQDGGLNLNALGARPKLFVRDIPAANAFGIPNRRMDLADVVGGGSGFGSGRRYACVNPVTGHTAPQYRSEQRTGGNGYVKVPSLPFVDGVFVPLAQGGLMRISTAGHHFKFPPAKGNWYVEPAHAGKADPRSLVSLDGQSYGTVDRPALLMHANLGITFDLDAIRGSLRATRIKGFRSVCGISNHVQRNRTPDAIFYVLVDSQIRFCEEIELPAKPAVNIHIELRQHERFLTLVCLAGSANNGDWTLFGVPALELEGMVE